MPVKSPSYVGPSEAYCLCRAYALLTALVCLLQMPHSGFAAERTEKLDFNFQVRPILADRCFKCHGPDEKARKAKLRLDLPETALAFRDKDSGKPAILPGKPDESELCRRIVST